MSSSSEPAGAVGQITVFESIVCGVDDTPESVEAARQASLLRSRRGTFVLCAVADVAAAAQAGLSDSPLPEELVRTTRSYLELAEEEVRPTATRLVKGAPVWSLLRELRTRRADLLALGARRPAPRDVRTFGEVGRSLLRQAPCSVLVARSPVAGGPPRAIALGIDGSPQSARAARVASELAERFDVRLTVLVGLGGKLLDVDAAAALAPSATFDSRPPVDVLVDASTAVDLLVLGSRGLHGLAALGSVSERVALRACCSVLVVRGLP